MSLKENVTAARVAAGLSQPELAAKAGVSQQLISQIESGTNQTTRKLGQIAAALGVSPAELDPQFAGPMNITMGAIPNARDPRPIPPDYSRETIPVFGSVEGGPDGRFQFNGDVIDRVAAPPGLRGAKDAYALYVVGTSMEPRYFEGEAVYVHPGRPVRQGDFVVLHLNPESEGEPYGGVVKRLVSKSPLKIVVEQYNPRMTIEFNATEVGKIDRIVLGGE